MTKTKKEEAVIMPKGAKRCIDCQLVRVAEVFPKGSSICETCIKTRKTAESKVPIGKGGRPKFAFQGTDKPERTKFPPAEKILGVGFRTLNEEYYLDAEQTKKFLKKAEFSNRFDWLVQNVNEPRVGDIYPGFIRATMRIFLEKMGWKVKAVGDLRLTKQKIGGKHSYAVFAVFKGKHPDKMVGKKSPVGRGKRRGFTKPHLRRKKR